MCSGIFCTLLYDALCFFVLADILSDGADCDDCNWRDQWIWYGQNAYDGNVPCDDCADCTGILASQSKYCTIIKRNRKQGLSEQIKNKERLNGGAKVYVLGAGSWGTALSLLLHKNGHQVKLWSALENEVKMLNEKREHESKLPGVRIPEEVEITTDLEGCLRDVDVAVLAVPSPFTRSTAKQMAPFVKEGQIIVNVAKGVEEDTLMTLSDIISEEIPAANVCVLSGPSHAEEVGRGLPTTCVVSAAKRETAEYLQGIFMSPVFRVYTTPDILGVELGGALKNVIALAAGTADGLGYGDNTKAALITRGIAEIARLGTKMGASQETFYGLSGMGDLIVTCASVHSRNRKAGYLMGKGYTMQQAMDEVKMVVEGVYSAKAARSLAEKYDVDMPIIMEVNKVLFEDKPAADAVRDLMIRDKKVETPMLPW